MARYYGYYSNASRRKRKEAKIDDTIPCILEPVANNKALRKSRVLLRQKSYEVDPPPCPKCQDVMRIISTHLGLWLI